MLTVAVSEFPEEQVPLLGLRDVGEKAVDVKKFEGTSENLHKGRNLRSRCQGAGN